LARFVAGSITEVWPGAFVGSGLIANPAAWKFSNKVSTIFVASRTTYRDSGWVFLNDAVPLLFDDAFDGITVGQLAKLLKIFSLHPPEAGRYAFLCQGGLNRSSLMACLWRWWHTQYQMAKIIQELKDARLRTDPQIDVLCNEQFVNDLLSFDSPLTDRIGEAR
jgi:hypothetical protein